MDIIHRYNGFKIIRKERTYWRGNEVFYIIEGIEDEIFWRLKDAKLYIDKFLKNF